MSHDIDYGNLMHRALCGLIREVLQDVADEGLPGEHHFFITFNTMHPDVELADWLSDRYPEEMTMVVQHQFDDLTVGDEGFSITLFFGGKPEPIYVPWDAIRTFADPSVEFGLVFKSQTGEQEEAVAADMALEAISEPDDIEAPQQPLEAEIVSLDKFRK